MHQKLLLSFLLLFWCSLLFSQQKGYYRSPTIWGNTVVFTAEGDLWKYDMSTGFTARLTTHNGVETNPAISPDGKQVAFTGQYEGATELYIMNLNGSVPKRLTFDFDNSKRISGWTKDGKILYRTNAYSKLPSEQLFTLDPQTLTRVAIPLAQASYGSYNDAGDLFFTRFPFQNSQTKRYKGGFIEQVWKFDGKREAIPLTADFEGSSTSPMVYNNRVYFLSDRDGTMNIWSMDANGKDVKQHTFSKGWDIQSPAINASKIVYQKGANIWLYDIAANNEKMLDISLASDFDQRKPRWIKSPATSISYADISPNGNYAAIISRGRVFVSPAKSDRWVEVSRKSGIRAKQVHFINDKSLAVLSDESGEYEVWKMNADGSGEAQQITKESKTLITSFAVSPDAKWIAYFDKNWVLRIADAASGAVKFHYDSSAHGISEFSWSPDSRFLNFSRSIENMNSQICVIDTRNMKIIPLTTTRLNSNSPSWSADSNWLYFVSERNFVTTVPAPWGSRQPEPHYTEASKIYAIPLDADAKFPFLETDSWLMDSTFTPSTHKKEKKKGNRTYDWSKLQTALYEVPVKNANISGVEAADGYLYWLDDGPEENVTGGKIFALKIGESKDYKPVEIADKVQSFNLSANKKKLILNFGNKSIAIANADGKKIDTTKDKLQLENWAFEVNPQQDWAQMFDDAWRMMRDYFYDRDLHRVNWVAVKAQYQPLLSRVTDRYELDDLLSQMVGELSALHTFVYGGEKRTSSDVIQTGFLGATLSPTNKGVRIDHIYKSDPDYPNFTSPLHRPELSIQEGDVITAVNNVSLTEVTDIAELLANKVSIPVKLTLWSKSGKQYEEVVKPISARDAFTLRYEEWELGNRETVDRLSNEDIGYIHLKAMTGNDMDDFVKQFYPVFNRKGLIIDVRENHGGNIDSWILEKLMRKAWMYWQPRAGVPYWNMQYAFRGQMVIVCDQQTASDGEAVAEGFRRLGLGKVLGMRTWGGEIWLSSSNRLVDNGIASAAEMGVYGPEGNWLIEGRGVEPDITVDNLPFETYKGKDAQLEAAVDYLKKQIKEHPAEVPPVPQHPDKSFNYTGK